MQQFGGKNAKKPSSESKRHFTVVMRGKEHGLYVSSTPSSAAKKAVTKLCAANKSKKVEFSIREITQGSKKKTYGPYEGYIEKLKEPIELKGRVIKYKPIAKLGAKKGVQKGGSIIVGICDTITTNIEKGKIYAESAVKTLLDNPKYAEYIKETSVIKNNFNIKLKDEHKDKINLFNIVVNGLPGCRLSRGN
jgi:hypothetical protein